MPHTHPPPRPGFSACSVEISVINSLSLEHLSSSREACRRTMFRTQHCLIPFTRHSNLITTQEKTVQSWRAGVLTYGSCSDPWCCRDRSQMGGVYEQTVHPKRPGQPANYRIRKYNNHFTETGQRQLQNPSSVIPSLSLHFLLMFSSFGTKCFTQIISFNPDHNPIEFVF